MSVKSLYYFSVCSSICVFHPEMSSFLVGVIHFHSFFFLFYSFLECHAEHFKCRDTGYCIPSMWKCNGIIDCNDSSDEEDCKHSKASKYNNLLKFSENSSVFIVLDTTTRKLGNSQIMLQEAWQLNTRYLHYILFILKKLTYQN